MRVLIVDGDVLNAALLVAACEQFANVPPIIDPRDFEFNFKLAWDPELFRMEGDWKIDFGRIPEMMDRPHKPVHNWRAAHFACDRMPMGGMR